MGDLSKERVTPLPPFDFFVPFVTLNGKKLSKSYMALFVCFTANAIKLKLTSGLSVHSCTAALRRLYARRDVSARMYSKWTEFFGTKNELRHLQLNLTIKVRFNSEMSRKIFNADLIEIIWTRILPGASHFGGKQELKLPNHIWKSQRKQCLDVREISTLLCYIEAIRNSRPLHSI